MPLTPLTAQPHSSPPLIVLGTQGDGWSSVEVVGAEDGLVRWAYEPRQQLLNNIVCHAGTVFVATREGSDRGLAARSDAVRKRALYEPVQVVALHARDGAEVWRVNSKRIAGRMTRWRLWQAVRVGLGGFNWHDVRWALEALRLTGYTWLATDGDRLYVGKGAVLWALDITTGRLRWLVASPPGRRLALLAAGGGRVFVEGGGYGGVQALEAQTGHVCWRYPGAWYGPMTVGQERLYLDVAVAPTADQSRRRVLTTVQVADGVTLQQVPQDPDQETLLAFSDPGIAYLLREERLCAVRLEDAALLWSSARLVEDPEALAPNDRPARNGSQVWMAVGQNLLAYAFVRFTSASQTLHVGALDPLTGTTRWRWHGPERPLPLSNGVTVMLLHGIVAVSLCDGVYALRGEDGRLLWHIPSATSGPPLMAAVTASPDLV